MDEKFRERMERAIRTRGVHWFETVRITKRNVNGALSRRDCTARHFEQGRELRKQGKGLRSPAAAAIASRLDVKAANPRRSRGAPIRARFERAPNKRDAGTACLL